MKKFLTAALVTVTTIFAAGTVNAQGKMGYVSVEELTSIMPETAKADSAYQQYRGALIQNAQEKESSLQTQIEKFNKDSATMSNAVKDVKRANLQKMLTDLQGEDQRIQQQLQQKQQELIQPINKKAFEAVQAVAKESGYQYIFDKSSLLVAPPGEDVLPLVAKKLNLKIPSQAGQGIKPGPQAPRAPAQEKGSDK